MKSDLRRKVRAVLTVCLVGGWVAASVSAQAETPHMSSPYAGQGEEIVNLGLASGWGRTRLHGGGFAFTVNEFEQSGWGGQGNTDLNGDGDSEDTVWHVMDADGTVQNLGLAYNADIEVASFSGVSLTDGGFAIAASEARQGHTDLNADGDTDDYVLHVRDSSGVVTNLGYATAPGRNDNVDGGLIGVALTGGRLAFRVYEGAQGGTDVNGDGDSQDGVWFAYEPGGQVVNLAVAGPLSAYGGETFGALALDNGNFAMAISEANQGHRDLNGDGDAADSVWHVFAPGWSSTNLALAYSRIDGGPGLDLGGGRLAFSVAEDEQGKTDLNGDGDTSDYVWHISDANFDIANLGTSGWGHASAVALAGGGMATTGESPGGRTLSIVDSAGTVTGYSVSSDSYFPGTPLRTGGLVVRVSETEDDLNGDGDSDDHGVLHVVDATGAFTNLGFVGHELTRAGSGFYELGDSAFLEESFPFVVSETGQGHVDLNGDGDTSDDVVHVRTENGQIENLGLATSCEGVHSWLGTLLADGRTVFHVSEVCQGGNDLNLDGDTADHVLHVADADGSGAIVDFLPAGSAAAIALDGGGFVFAVLEAGGQDLNGDGDTVDAVLHMWRPTANESEASVSVPNLGVDLRPGDVVDSDVSVTTDPLDGKPATVNADVTFETSAGEAYLRVRLRRVWVLPLYLGQVSLSGAGVPSLDAFHIGPVTTTGTTISGRTSWFRFTPPFTLTPYAIQWTVDNPAG